LPARDWLITVGNKEEPAVRAWIRNHQLVSFFVLTYAIAYVTVFGYIFIRPGTPMLGWTPIWFLFIFSPSISAIVVSWIVGGVSQVKRLLSGFTRWRIGSRWYLAALFLFLGPLVIVLVYIALGHPPTGLRPGWTIPLLLAQAFTQFFAGPLSEEAGWRGFALPRLEARYNALVSSLILGVIWTFWHLPLFYLTGATQMSIPMPIYLLLTLTLTVYMTWLYNNTHGSLIITTLAHYSYNLTGTLLTGPLSLMPAMVFYLTAGPLLFLVVVGIVIYFGPRSLSRRPEAELPFRRQRWTAASQRTAHMGLEQ
jgi:membrane protease YdiL (CAAX protease family)